MLILTTCAKCPAKFWEDEPHYMCTSCSETVCAECVGDGDPETRRCVCNACAGFCACGAELTIRDTDSTRTVCGRCL
jgi:hypothetical protein